MSTLKYRDPTSGEWIPLGTAMVGDPTGSRFKLLVKSNAMSMATSGNTFVAWDAITDSQRYGTMAVILSNGNQDVKVPEAGYYDLNIMLNFAPHATGTRTTQIFVNGSAMTIVRQPSNGGTEYVHAAATALAVYITPSDIIQGAVQQTSGTVLASSPSPTYQQMQIHRVG